MGHKVVDIIHNEIIDATSDLIIDYITIFDGNNIDVTKNYSIALPENNFDFDKYILPNLKAYQLPTCNFLLFLLSI